LHWQQQIPFEQQQMLHRPSDNMRHRFCNVPRATSSSQRQWILQPVEVFSNSTVQRGSTHQFAFAGDPAGNEPGCKPCIGLENGATADEPRSNNCDDAMKQTPSEWPISSRLRSGSRASVQ
jgi:hypothetical protein